MPGFNKRGPEGMGPMTGGGLGFCSRGASFGSGRGLRNRCSGMGHRMGFGYGNSKYPELTDEKKVLKSQAALLKDELEAVEKRLSELKNE